MGKEGKRYNSDTGINSSEEIVIEKNGASWWPGSRIPEQTFAVQFWDSRALVSGFSLQQQKQEHQREVKKPKICR